MTRILALETSGMSGSVAALDTDTSAIAYEALPPTARSAQALAPAMKRALDAAGWKPQDVEVVAITQGPGSFTGLRIGVTTAKTLAYAVGAEVIAVNTLDVLARQAPRDGLVLWTALDAHRSQFFVNRYTRVADGDWQRENPDSESSIVEVEAFVAGVVAYESVNGPVLEKPSLKFAAQAKLAPREVWNPRADTVARLAAELYAAGRRDDLWKLVPFYGRLAAAEERRIADGKS